MINTINITLLVIALGLMFFTKDINAVLLGIGFFISSVLNLLFNNLPKKEIK